MNNENLNSLINRFSNFILANIQKFNPQHLGLDRDDLYQEVKIKLWKTFSREREIENHVILIKRIVDTTVIDSIRKARRQLEIQSKAIFLENMNNPVHRSKEDRSTGQNIEQVLDCLKEPRKTVVRLYLLELTIDEISIMFNWSHNKTRNLLYRGLKDIKMLFKDLTDSNEK